MNNINLLKKILLEKYIDTSELNNMQLKSFLLFFKNEIGVNANSLVDCHDINNLYNMKLYIYQDDNYLRFSSVDIEDLKKSKKHFLSIKLFWILTKLRNENCDVKELYYEVKKEIYKNN